MTRALLILRTQADRDRATKWVAHVPSGTRLEFKAPCRSIDQNALMWPLLKDIATQVVWYGEKHSAEDWKDMLTASLRKCRVVPGIDAGTFVPLGMRTSDMSKAEMSALIELIYAFGTQHDVVFKDKLLSADANARSERKL